MADSRTLSMPVHLLPSMMFTCPWAIVATEWHQCYHFILERRAADSLTVEPMGHKKVHMQFCQFMAFFCPSSAFFLDPLNPESCTHVRSPFSTGECFAIALQGPFLSAVKGKVVKAECGLGCRPQHFHSSISAHVENCVVHDSVHSSRHVQPG